jgi:hypothetical protein
MHLDGTHPSMAPGVVKAICHVMEARQGFLHRLNGFGELAAV